MSVVEMAFGKNAEEQLVHIKDAKNGLACECCCIECNAPLVAKQGAVVEWHFAHAAKTSCQGYNPETLLHWRAKYLIAEMIERDGLHAFLPDRLFNSRSHKLLNYKTSRTESRLPGRIIFPELNIQLTLMDEYTDLLKETLPDKGIMIEVEGSSPCRTYRPDVALYPDVSTTRPFTGIEVIVTHVVDEKKESKIATAEDASILVNLKGVDRSSTDAELVKAIQDNIAVASYGEGHLEKYAHEAFKQPNDTSKLDKFRHEVGKWLKVDGAEFTATINYNTITLLLENEEKRLLREAMKKAEISNTRNRLLNSSRMYYGFNGKFEVVTSSEIYAPPGRDPDCRCIECGQPLVMNYTTSNRVTVSYFSHKFGSGSGLDTGCEGPAPDRIRRAKIVSKVESLIIKNGLHSILPDNLIDHNKVLLDKRVPVIELVINYGSKFSFKNLFLDNIDYVRTNHFNNDKFPGNSPDLELKTPEHLPVLIDISDYKLNHDLFSAHRAKARSEKTETRKCCLSLEIEFPYDPDNLSDEEISRIIKSTLRIESLGAGTIRGVVEHLLSGRSSEEVLFRTIERYLNTSQFSYNLSDSGGLSIYVD